MRRCKGAERRTPSQAAADRRSGELAARLGRMLKDARGSLRLTQQRAADRAGISRGTWSDLEVAGDGRYTLATWNLAAMAVGANLDAYLRRASSTTQPRDAVHLRHQELIIRAAVVGGWRALPEEAIDRDPQTSRWADVMLSRATEFALVEVWDWFDDVGASLRAWGRRLDALDRYATARMAGDGQPPRVSGCWVVRGTLRNRRLVGEHRHTFHARFPGHGHTWLAALSSRVIPMPAEPALLWVSVDGMRLFPARLG